MISVQVPHIAQKLSVESQSADNVHVSRGAEEGAVLRAWSEGCQLRQVQPLRCTSSCGEGYWRCSYGHLLCVGKPYMSSHYVV